MTDILAPGALLFSLVFDAVVLYLTVKAGVGARRGRQTTSDSPLPAVSIVIPFRNEAHNLPPLLASLQAQRYPADIELILVNDRSGDDFLPLLEAFGKQCPHLPLRLVDSHYDPSIRLTSKQQALETGVGQARHDWLVFTDADMRFSPDWLASLLRGAEGQTALIYGHTALHSETGTLFHRLQAFQLDFLFATAYAFHHSGIPGSCMGNNLAVRKSVYEQLGGQHAIGYSIVEDRDLFRALRKAGHRIQPAEPFVARAFSYPLDRFDGFLQQALRWARGGLTGGIALQPFMLLFGLQNLLVLVAALGLLPPAATVAALSSLAVLLLFLAIGFGRIGSRESLLLFPVFYLFLIIQTILVGGSLLLRRPVRWKERQL